MGKLSQRSIVDKADIAVSNLVSDGGYLNPMQANRFIRDLVDQPTMLNEIRVVPMSAPKMEINKIGFANRILHAAPASGTALTENERSKPTTDKLTLTTSEIIAQVNIPYDVLEDNIERGQLDSTIMSMITERAALDLEELLILGYTGSSDAYLATQNGVLILGDDHNVEFTTPPTSYDVNTLFKPGIHAMPVKYLRNRNAMRFYVSHYIETEFAASQVERETPLGDARISANYANALSAFGVPVRPCALMPDANYVLTHPQNIIMGVQRQIQIERDKDITTRMFIIVLTMRVALAIEETDAVVKATGLTATGTTTY